MTQGELTRAVAAATGESCRTIRSLGFSLAESDPDEPAAGPAGLYLDCPGCGRAVRLTRCGYDQLPPAAECPGCDAIYPYALEEVYDSGLAPAPALC